MQETEIDKKQASHNLFFFHKEIEKTGKLLAVLMCRKCEENCALGDLLDQLGKEELIALKERINRRLAEEGK
jgi:carbonic anhydrase